MEIAKIGHSVIWAVALVAVAWLIAPALQPHVKPVQGQGATISTGQVQTIAQHTAANVAAQLIKQELPHLRVSAGDLATALSSLKPPTKTVVYETTKVIPPSAAPKPTAAPGMSKETAKFFYDTSYSADVAALHNTKIDNTLHIEQQKAILGRFSTAISANGAAGIGYDFARRGPMNLTISLLQQRSIMPALSINYCLTGTSLCAGPVVDAKGNISAQLEAHF